MTRFTLAEHQQYALEMMEVNPSLMLAYEAGTGKTAIALSWILKQLRIGRIKDALVICPASLVTNWKDSIDKMIMFEGVTEEDVKLLHKAVKLTSFQKTYRTSKVPVSKSGDRVTFKRVITIREPVDRLWGAIFIDESHCIGSHSSVQTKTALALSKHTKFRYLLTGTPVSGGGGAEDFSKLYSQLKFLDPSFCNTWTQFMNEYVTAVDRWYKPCAYDVKKCRQALADHAIVARLEDCFDMPERTDTVITCPLEETKVYKDMYNGNTSQYNIEIRTAGGQYLKMLQVCSGSLKCDVGGTLKLKTSKDAILEDIVMGTDDKVVVFCNYRASVDRVAGILKKFGKTEVYDGRSQTPTWKRFQNGDSKYLVCQYQSGGTGIDLYASHTMVLFEPCMSSLLLTQSLARIFRKGQTNHCTYYYLSTPKSVESKAWDSVRGGVDVTEAMMLSWSGGDILGGLSDRKTMDDW